MYFFFKAMKKELETLKKQLDVLHKQLEDEVVLRTELEHKFATCKEDLDFAQRNHDSVSLNLLFIFYILFFYSKWKNFDEKGKLKWRHLVMKLKQDIKLNFKNNFSK